MSAEGWKTVRLEDALSALIDYRGKTPKKSSSGVPLITAKIVKNGFIQEPDEFIREQDYASWMVRGFPQIGDVILTTEAPLGEVAQLNNERVALAQRIVALRGKDGLLDNSYLKYFLKSETGQSRLKERETGTTVTGIKQSELRKVEIDVPPYPIQTRIASILSALDDKIELNRRTNATLEAIAQAIFKEWFVDFRFPGATGEMQDSASGPIPKGWQVEKLGELSLKITKGTTPTTLGDKFVEKGINFFRAECVQDDVEIDDTKSLFITPNTHNKLRRSQLAEKDILITIAGSIGRVGIVSRRILPANINQAISVIRLDTQKNPILYIFYYLKQQAVKNELISGVTQSVQANISLGDLSNLKIIIPPKYLLEKFDSIATAIREYIEELTELSVNVTALRNSLLPKLMTGEVEV